MTGDQLELKLSHGTQSRFVEGFLKPPKLPWLRLNFSGETFGYLTIYYSDNLSRLPVRWITKPGDNKSDPNLETLTYGLFSTCARPMRSGIVRGGAEFLFFASRREGERVLTGYYHLRWYAETGFEQGDYCIAADEAHFVADPVPLVVVDKKCGTDVSNWFRSCRKLTGPECRRLRELLHRQTDVTPAYLAEIERLERFNLHYGGYRYVGWRQKKPFSWDYAKEYLSSANDAARASKAKNSNVRNLWTCNACGQAIRN